MSNSLNANAVLHKLALALPKEHHESIIIVGSLSAAAQLIKEVDAELRTKDIDGMLAPNAAAVVAGKEIVTNLIEQGWAPRTDLQRFTFPADRTTPPEKLPVIRLKPPGEEKNEWFLELLGAPPALAPDEHGNTRFSSTVATAISHFEIPSFAYLGVTQYQPVLHESGLQLASIATMALSNLLHHPKIEDNRMSAPIEARYIKRANKDLGRVIAMASIADQLEENAIESWPTIWQNALEVLGAPQTTLAKLGNINSGVLELLESRDDQDEALHSVNYGLLSSRPMDMQQFQIAIKRYLRAFAEEEKGSASRHTPPGRII